MAGWLYARKLLPRIGQLEKAFAEKPDGCAAVFKSYNSTLPDKPDFAFAIRDEGPAILERKTGIWITLMDE